MKYRIHITYKVPEEKVWTTGTNIELKKLDFAKAAKVFMKSHPNATIISMVHCG